MFVDNIDKALQSLSIEVEKLKKQANDQFPKIMQLHNIANPEICNVGTSNAFKVKTYYSSLVDPTTVEQVDKKLEEYRKMFEKVEWRKIINLPESAHIEGGDVIVWNDFLFIGTCFSEDYRSYKTARTNEYAIEILKEYFPKKRIIDLDLKKNDRVPYQGILHLDCTFNPIGKDKCIIYKDGFVDESDYQLLIDIFGEENTFHVTAEEMFAMNPNVFSISPEIVVSDKAFKRMNDFLRNEWNFTVEEINYREISKMGGLLRCSTMPLIRE